MELRELITPAGHGSASVDAHLAWYTKDLMVEETSSSPTSSPQLSLDPSPCDSTSSSPLTSDLYSLPSGRPTNSGLHAPPMALTSQPIFSLPRPRIGSSSALLPAVPSSSSNHRAPSRQQKQPNSKRKRSVSDSLVPSGTRSGHDEDELDVDELCIDDDGDEFDDIERNPVARARAQLGSDSERLMSRREAPAAEDDDDESDDGFVESGEEGDDGHHHALDVGSLLPRAVRLQGHESGPPSPPATHYQHGMNENPDGTAYYHCKFCQHTWPQHHFRNAQQFGAHCSNCSRKRKVKDPQDMTTTTRERNKRLRKGKRSRSSSASKSSFDQTRHKLIDSDDSSAPEGSSQETEKVRKHGHGHQATSAGSVPKKLRARAAGPRPQQPARILAAPVLASGRFSPSTSVGGAAALRSGGGEGSMDGMERLFGAMKKRESAEVSQKKKSIFALLACVKTELASLKEQEDGEEIELASREMIQDTRTEWGARIQELRVDAASDLRAHSAALPRRLERLASLHPRHPGHQQQMRARNSLDFILNGSSSSSAEPTSAPAPAWAFSSGGRTSFAGSVVPATPPPSPMSAARHHQQQRGAEVLNLAQPSSAPNLRSSGFVPSGHSCAMPASSLACMSPLTSPL